MAKEGWVKIHRRIMDNDIYFAEPFTKAQAWVDLILLANHAPKSFQKRGIQVYIERGQVGHDLDTLSVRWKWSRGKVERFFIYLENEQMIVRQKTNITTLLSILNFEQYQGDGKANNKANGKANSKTNDNPNTEITVRQTVTQTDTNKNVKKLENDIKEEENNTIITPPVFEKSFFTLIDFRKYFTESQQWRESVRSKRSLTEDQLVLMFNDFISEQEDKKTAYPSQVRAIPHFINWLNLKIKTKKYVSQTDPIAEAKALAAKNNREN